MSGAWDSRWFANSRFDGGLCIPGRPRRRAFDLLLGSDAVTMEFGPHACVLDWADFTSDRLAPYLLAGDSSELPSHWRVDSWLTAGGLGWGGPIGVAVFVGGGYVESTALLRRRNRSLINWISTMFDDGVRLPVAGRIVMARSRTAEMDTLAALCALLADQPEMRGLLDDREVVDSLIGGLAACSRRAVWPPGGMRRLDIETLTALRSLGYVHRYGGRPLPGDALPQVSEVWSEVLRTIRANPHNHSLKVDETEVRQLISRHYLSVDPWPFEAFIR